MKEARLKSDPSVLGTVAPGIIDHLPIANEPMLYSASIDFALENGGPITQDVLTQIHCSGFCLAEAMIIPMLLSILAYTC